MSGKKLHIAIVEIGAGNEVSTVRNLSEQLSRVHDATLIIINPHDYKVPLQQDISLSLGAAEAIKLIVECMGKLT